jgi:hypothetical protein
MDTFFSAGFNEIDIVLEDNQNESLHIFPTHNFTPTVLFHRKVLMCEKKACLEIYMECKLHSKMLLRRHKHRRDTGENNRSKSLPLPEWNRINNTNK